MAASTLLSEPRRRFVHARRRLAVVALAGGALYVGLVACDVQRLSLGDDGPEDAGIAETDVLGREAEAPETSAATCAHGSPFESARLVRGLEDIDVASGRLTPDEDTIYLSIPSEPGTFSHFDLYSAGRLSPGDAFGARTKLSLSTSSDDYWATTSSDGMVMFFESGALADGGFGSQSRIWFASRTTIPGNFSSTIWDYFANVPSEVSEGAPYLSPSGRTLYWMSIYRGGRVSLDVWAADVTTGGTVAAAYPVGGAVNTDADNEMFPAISADDRELFFSRSLSGTTEDVFASQRASPEEAFLSAAKVDGPVNTSDAAEWAAWVSPDDCRLYFVRKTTSADNGVSGRLWVAERKPGP